VSVDLSFLQALILSYFLPANMFVVFNLLLLWYFVKVLPVIVIPAYLQQGDYLSFLVVSAAAFLAFMLQTYRNFLEDFFSGNQPVFFLRPVYWVLLKIQLAKRGYYAYRIAKLNTARRKKTKTREASLNIKLERFRQKLEVKFPTQRLQTMPTSLGNVLIAEKSKLLTRHGGLPESSWNKLIMKLPVEYRNRVDEADNYLMFSLVCSFLSFVLLLELGTLNLLAYLKYGLTILLDTGMPLILAFAFGMFFYQMSIKLALQYGEVVENCLELSKET
jgi:hypothetical protein